MLTHSLRITGATAAIILCTFLPFLPGRYDSLAVPLSLMAQLFGMVGLLLVPVGALWMASGKHYAFAIAALIVSSVVWLLVSLGALVSSPSLALAALGLGIYLLWRAVPWVRRLKNTPPPATAMPLYMAIVPVAVLLLRLVLARPATEFSRSRAIQNSAPLIAAIEEYRAARGQYPTSLLSLSGDYLPGVIGITEYYYEPRGDAYNLLFEQSTFILGSREIVMYNPRDQQVMTSHRLDLLRLTPEQLALEHTRGHYAVHDAPHPHWKYFWFD